MKLVALFLIILTTGQGCSGQNGYITQCGMNAMGCWIKIQDDITKADTDMDLVAGCKLFSNYNKCFANVVKNATCLKDRIASQINYQNYVKFIGICLADGTLDTCGVTVQSCFNDVLAIQNAFAKNNATAACPVMIKFRECSSQALSNPNCGNYIRYTLEKIESSIFESTLMHGCDGNCGQKVGICLNNITDIMVNGDFLNMDWKRYCRDAYGAVGCVMNLKNDTYCAHDQLVEQTSESQSSVLRNYCSGDGKPAPCLEVIRNCTNVWRSESTNESVAVQCQAASNYITCTSRVTCAAEMKDLLLSLRTDIETKQTSENCPLVGTCTERMTSCAGMKNVVDRAKKNQHDKNYCIAMKTASACFASVRNDKWCVEENINTTDFENSLPKLMGPACSGGYVSISVLLLAIVLLFNAALLL
jgi:hypothetical protein